jgi:signal transduction histidine kinase
MSSLDGVMEASSKGRASDIDPRAMWTSRVRLLWFNRPVSDETTFAQEYRSHSFGFSVASAWSLAVIGPMLIIVRLLVVPSDQGVAISSSAATPLIPRSEELLRMLLQFDNLSSIVLFWIPPIVFVIFRRQAEAFYQWLLALVFAALYFRVAQAFAVGTRPLVTSVLAVSILNLYLLMFLRLPFRHALVLGVLANAVISVLWVVRATAYVAFAPVVIQWLLVFVSLYANWRVEERDRQLFEKRRQVEVQRAIAEEQTRIANEAATEARVESARRLALNEQLRNAGESRLAMISKLHHDASQSMTVIGVQLRQLSQELKEQRAGNSSPMNRVRVMRQAASELHGLSEGLADLVTFGEFEPRYSAVSVYEVLEYMRTAYMERAEAKNLDFRIRHAATDIYIWTDQRAFQRMLGNLVSNAIKYTPSTKIDSRTGNSVSRGVVLGAVRVGRQRIVRFDVQDNGVGIPKEADTQIYQEFVRIDSGDPTIRGLGLGLAIVRELRDKLEGHYVDHYSIPGRGSRFSISAPMPSPGRAPTSTEEINGLPTSNAYVVLVEDDQAVRNALMDMLGMAGYSVAENVRAIDTASALDVVFDRMPDRPPNVLITDYRLLRGESATDVIHKVDERFPWAVVPIVVFTAELNPQLPTRRHLWLVRKSDDPAPLLRAMNQAMREARAEAQLDDD